MAVSDPVQRYEVLSKVVKNHCVRQSSSMASGVRLPTSFGRLQLNGCCALSSGHPMQVVSGCEELSAVFTIPSLGFSVNSQPRVQVQHPDTQNE